MAYYIYHIPGVKIGCTKNLKHRIKSQGFIEYEILEEHYDINLASDRERQLQRKYGYQVDSGTNVYSNTFSNMGKKGGAKNSDKQRKWRNEFTIQATEKAIENTKSGKWAELQKKGREISTKKRVESGIWETYRNMGTQASKKAILVFDKNNNFIKEYESITQTSIDLGMPLSTVANAVKGRRPSRKYNFKYK